MIAFMMFAALNVLLPGAVAFNVVFTVAAVGAVTSLVALLPVAIRGWMTGQGFNRPETAGRLAAASKAKAASPGSEDRLAAVSTGNVASPGSVGRVAAASNTKVAGRGSADLDGLAGGTVMTTADIGDEGFNA